MSDDQWNYGGITWSTTNDNNWEYRDGSAYEGGFNTFNGITLSPDGSAIIGDIEDAGVDLPPNQDRILSKVLLQKYLFMKEGYHVQLLDCLPPTYGSNMG